MLKITCKDFSGLAPIMRNVYVLVVASMASSSALAYGGVPMASVSTAFALAIVAVVLLVLDGLKRQFEERAFFGTLAGVAAVLMAAGMLLGGANRNYNMEDNDTAAVVETAPTAAVPMAMQGSDLELRLGDQTANGDTGLDLPGTQTQLKVSCYQDVSVHLLSKQALPDQLVVKIQAQQLEPSTRLAEETVDASNSEGFERIFKMDTRCDLMTAATIEVEGLKTSAASTAAAGNKITVQISKY
jgi:hypothetical protein